jgi:hypothetical protein
MIGQRSAMDSFAGSEKTMKRLRPHRSHDFVCKSACGHDSPELITKALDHLRKQARDGMISSRIRLEGEAHRGVFGWLSARVAGRPRAP